jgi:SAM-dependent methyltransferase
MLPVPQRSTAAEIMDRPDNAEADLRRALCDLRAVNKFLGGRRALWRALRPLVERMDAGRPIELLDVGAGDAELPRVMAARARRLGRRLAVTALDRDAVTAAIAARETAGHGGVRVVCGDALRLPFRPRSFDVVTASLLLHHLTDEQIVRLLATLCRTARVAVVINDLRRHWVPWLAIHVVARAARCHPMVVHDGPVSVLRGFTPGELRELARRAGAAGARVRGSLTYRLVLTLSCAEHA